MIIFVKSDSLLRKCVVVPGESGIFGGSVVADVDNERKGLSWHECMLKTAESFTTYNLENFQCRRFVSFFIDFLRAVF